MTLSADRVPPLRLRAANEAPARPERDLVLYWMIASRRRGANFALQRAVELAREHGRPLVILEALRIGHRFASDRLHTFVLQGMAANARAFARTPVAYHPYVEPEEGAGEGLLEALGARACAVVTDDFPSFFLPRMLAAAAARLDCRLEVVDGNGLLPLRATARAFPTAHTFRRFLHAALPEHLGLLPAEDPLAGPALPEATVPAAVRERWPAPPADALDDPSGLVADLPVDHAVSPGWARGGAEAGAARLAAFVRDDLAAYGEGRNHPDDDRASGLSPYLHFGHVSAPQVLRAVADAEGWSLDRVLGQRPTGKRAGWWGMGPSAESFLDELVTWRELALNGAAHLEGSTTLEGQPDWAKRTMDAHRGDPRPVLYSLEELDAAATGDPVWNAAQRQLVREGRLHNYLRMLWGKKVYEWSESPEQAAERLIALNDRYALDGRDPSSYAGIFWVMGRYDRAWGPERPVYGKLRYMTSESTRRKLRMEQYLARYGPASGPQ